MEQSVFQLSEDVSRTAEGICCPNCDGYAAETEVTNDEDEKYGCGRMFCCSRAFICKKCGARIVGTAEAPEYYG